MTDQPNDTNGKKSEDVGDLRQSPERPAVLVVEDEALLRMLAVDIVEESGFMAFAAADGDEAIALLERHSEIGILFTDIDMPGSMDGLTLARNVKERWPSVQVLLVSGHKRYDLSHLRLEGRFFGKPYDVDQISSALADLGMQQQS